MKKVTQKNRATTSMIITSLVMILLFLGLVALLVAQREHVQTHDEGSKEQRLKNLVDLNGENEKILTQYHWVDKTKGAVGIPIDRAMNLVLTEMQANRPHPAGPITTPLPPASPSSGAGATPGASVTPNASATPAAGGQPQNQGRQAPATGGQAAPAATPAGVLPVSPGASATPQNSRTNT
jgi:hypothetical protein